MEEQVLNWFVLYVMSGKEIIITEYLNKDENLNACYPQVEMVYRKLGKIELVKKPMFPSYIFVKSNYTMSEFQCCLKQKRKEKNGIIKELHYEKGIPSLTSIEIEMIEHLMDENAVLKKSIGLIEGDRVTIVEGPLRGYESHIVHIDRHKHKVKLSFQMLGKEVHINSALEIIKKIG